MTTTNYVLGFIFDPTGETVLLQLKRRPDWQHNKFNGIGGHIEEGEAPGLAMERECREETSLTDLDWVGVCELRGEGFCVYVYAAFTDEITGHEAPMGGELLRPALTNNLPSNCLPNLHWLIPMALSLTRGERCTFFVVTERP